MGQRHQAECHASGKNDMMSPYASVTSSEKLNHDFMVIISWVQADYFCCMRTCKPEVHNIIIIISLHTCLAGNGALKRIATPGRPCTSLYIFANQSEIFIDC